MLLYYFIYAIISIALILLFRKKQLTNILFLGFLLMQTGLTAYAFTHIYQQELLYFTYDSLGLIFLSLLNIIGFVAILHGMEYIKNCNQGVFSYYYAGLMAFFTAITGAYLSNDLTAVWIFVEATTISAAILIYHDRTKTALEATWKYVFVCSVGIALAYMGILFVSSTIHLNSFTDLSFENLKMALQHANPMYLKISFLLLFIGFSSKMELFPLHTVGIDANSIAPAHISALISTALTNVGFLAIFRVYLSMKNTEIFSWMNHVFIITGLISLLIAAAHILKAEYSKRMLAYSTMEHMGIVAIAVGIGGIGYCIAILHLIIHSLIKSSLFLQIGQTHYFFKSFRLSETGNYYKIFPLGYMVLMLGMIGIVAIPPSGLFITEFLLFKNLVLSGNWLILAAMVILITVITYALLVHILAISYNDTKVEADAIIKKNHYINSILQMILLIAAFALCFGIPYFLAQLIQNAIK